MVLLLLTFCLLLLPLWESVIVLCFAVRYFMSILVLQSSWWGRDSWLLCLICLLGVSWWLSGSYSRCHVVVCGLWLWYYLIVLTYYFRKSLVPGLYCNILHAWWSTQSRWASLLSSLIALPWVRRQTLWRFLLNEMVGAWCFGSCQAHQVYLFFCFFLALVFSFMYCWALFFALSPFLYLDLYVLGDDAWIRWRY